MELNDPLDLNGQLNFFSESEVEIKALASFIFKQAFISHMSHNQTRGMKQIMRLMSYGNLGSYLKAEFAGRSGGVVTKNDLFDILSRFYGEVVTRENDLKELEVADLFTRLDELFTQFLNNSSVACFSAKPTDFLMWSHYASGHTGICLEFEVHEDPENVGIYKFPMLSNVPLDGEFIEWTEDVYEVKYRDPLSQINFYEYLPVFNNEGDVDLMHLSKSHWHRYADGIKEAFLEKLPPWSSEQEWRLVHISFQKQVPEERILKFNITSLTGVYFGAKSSQETQMRVKKIVETANDSRAFYQAKVDGTRGVGFEKI